jgi:UDP-N-acetylmuramoyl-L-alanyl-D-glutamate--2,6-diaminopimelate ligase
MNPTRPLSGLLAELDTPTLVAGDATSVVTSVEHDSRRVAPGGLFVAVPGFNTDGHSYLANAAGNGAAAALIDEGHRGALPPLPADVAIISVPDTRRALSRAAAWFYDHPSRQLTVIGVTGTDGKTTT